MKKIKEYVLSFVSSKNSYESMTYANKLTMLSIVPLLIFAAAANMILFLLLSHMDIGNLTLNSAVLLLFAAVFPILDRTIKSEHVKYDLYNVMFCAILIFTVLRYYSYSGPAVWTISFVILLLSILRNNKRMLVAVCVTVFCLGIYVWAADLQYNESLQYHITQIIVLAVIFVVSAGVLNINQERFIKTSRFLNNSEMLSQLSFDFISVNAENLDEKVNTMLEKTAKYFSVDKACLFRLSKDQCHMIFSNEWRIDGLKQTYTINQVVAMNAKWYDRLEDKSAWVISNVNDVRNEHARGDLQNLNMKSVISMPVIIKEKVFGLLFYEAHYKYCDWTDEHIKMLTVCTNMLADAFLKVEAEKEINKMAYYDMLTGIPNRFHFDQRLNEVIESARIYNTNPAVMFIDLDSFKSINDAIGHEGGDELLKLVGTRLSEQLGSSGIVGRQGGDEFIVLIENTGVSEIKSFADALMSVFNRHIAVNDQEFFVTASAGIAIYPMDGEDAGTLKRNADLAMYAAKELGKNQASFCTPKLKDDIEKKVRMTNLLHRALEKGELAVYYQPLVDIASKEIIGVEALLRWFSPELGMVSPGVFIPLAEQTGLIFPIGRWVLSEACRQNKAWQDAGYKPIRMAVNLSVEQIRKVDLIDMIEDVLGESGLSPAYLELEITESVASRETDYICGILEAIKKLGVSISIDDFGTEYSSLARIKRLPIDRIKMAMEFVHGISVSEKDEAIAKVIINLANNLGLKVLAEGVETEYQFEFLKNRVCDEVQGYYFYKPMPAFEADLLLRNQISSKLMISTPS